MKKPVITVFCFLFLFIASGAFSEIVELPGNPAVSAVLTTDSSVYGQIAKVFVKTALDKIKAVGVTGIDMITIEREIIGYAGNQARFLLEGGLKKDAAASIMFRISGKYADILAGMLRGNNKSEPINAYLDSLRSMLSEVNLSSASINSIIELTRENFGTMSNLLWARWN